MATVYCAGGRHSVVGQEEPVFSIYARKGSPYFSHDPLKVFQYARNTAHVYRVSEDWDRLTLNTVSELAALRGVEAVKEIPLKPEETTYLRTSYLETRRKPTRR